MCCSLVVVFLAISASTHNLYSLCCCFFFFKQKTAYEMRISDWSSDVCSSDLSLARAAAGRRGRSSHPHPAVDLHGFAGDVAGQGGGRQVQEDRTSVV